MCVIYYFHVLITNYLHTLTLLGTATQWGATSTKKPSMGSQDITPAQEKEEKETLNSRWN
jgi:hypothetical protein